MSLLDAGNTQDTLGRAANVLKRPESVDRWLEIATKGLCAQAKERIRAEIQSHYDDAVAESMEQGLSAAEAHAAAVAGLGNPRRSRRAFRHSYLTERQARYVQQLGTPDRKRLRLPLFLVALFVLMLAFGGCRPVAVLGMACFLSFCATVSFIVLPHWMCSGRVRRALAISMIWQFVTLPVFVWLFFVVGFPKTAFRAVGISPLEAGFFGLIFVFIFGWNMAQHLMLLRSVGRDRAELGGRR